MRSTYLFLLAIITFGCDNATNSGTYLNPILYEYTGISYYGNSMQWVGTVNYKFYDNVNYSRIYYGAYSGTAETKNVIVTGKYNIESGKIYFNDEKILRINITGCTGWKDTTNTIVYPIQNILNTEFEIYGKIELWDVPIELKDSMMLNQDRWLNISDYRDTTGWPLDIRKCGFP